MSEQIREMVAYSNERLGRHIALVQSLGEKLGMDFSNHDYTKKLIDLDGVKMNDNYVLIDNYYREDPKVPVAYSDSMAEASFKHVKSEPHHPEYWDDTVMPAAPGVDRDISVTTAIVDATNMTIPAIVEMVCDWVAMAIERNNSPREWADRHIHHRWEFTEPQVTIIYALIDILWDPRFLAEAETMANQVSTPKITSATNPVLTEDPYLDPQPGTHYETKPVTRDNLRVMFNKEPLG